MQFITASCAAGVPPGDIESPGAVPGSGLWRANLNAALEDGDVDRAQTLADRLALFGVDERGAIAESYDLCGAKAADEAPESYLN